MVNHAVQGIKTVVTFASEGGTGAKTTVLLCFHLKTFWYRAKTGLAIGFGQS